MTHGSPETQSPRSAAPALLLTALLAAASLAVLLSRPPAEPDAMPVTGALSAAEPAQEEGEPETSSEADGEGEPAAGEATDSAADTPPDGPTAVPELVAIAASFPLAPLLPESEFVYGPTLFGTDTARVAQARGGYLVGHSEIVGGEVLDGPAIVMRVAREHSLGPRLLLTLLELDSGWVTEPTPAVLTDPLGVGEAGLYDSLDRMAEALNEAFYARRDEGASRIVLADGKAVDLPNGNPASWALLSWLSRTVPSTDWAGLERPSRFSATWQGLHDDDPLFFGNLPVRDAPAPPAIDLPFEFGQRWYAVAGPHAPGDAGGPPAEIDFAPPPASATGCFGSVDWVTAPVRASVRWSESYGVLLDLDRDGDGWEGTDWTLMVRHLSPVDRVAAGTFVVPGDRLGHPYCEDGGGQTRVALAWRYDGAWVTAARPGLPWTLGGWLVGDLGLGRPGLPPRSYREAKTDGLNDIAALLE